MDGIRLRLGRAISASRGRVGRMGRAARQANQVREIERAWSQSDATAGCEVIYKTAL